MKPASALFLYVALLFGSAAVLSPPVFYALSGWLPAPFHRYVDRLLMICAILWMVIFWRTFGLRSWADVHVFWRRLPGGIGRGLGVGLALAGLVFVVMLREHDREWVSFPSFSVLPLMVMGFLTLAALEELLFRGLAQTIFVRQLGVVGGVMAGTVLFAVMHFIKVPGDFAPNPVLWSSGWEALGLSFAAFGHGGWLGGYFVVLLLLGAVLSLCVLNYDNLGVAVGLHAGLIIGQRLIELSSRVGPSPSIFRQPINSHPATQVLLILLLIALLLRYRTHAKN